MTIARKKALGNTQASKIDETSKTKETSKNGKNGKNEDKDENLETNLA